MEDKTPMSVRQMLHAYGRALTAEEVGKVFAVSEDLIYKRAKMGSIPSFRIGTAIRFCPKTLSQWLEKQSA